MKDVALDRTTVLQLDSDGTNGALDPAADCDVLRDDASLDLCAVADEKLRGAQLPFDSTEDLRWTTAFDVADDRHAGADGRACRRRIRRRPRPRRGRFNDGLLLLHGLPHGFGQICRQVLFLLRCFTLEHNPPPCFPLVFTAERPKLSSRDRARADAEPLTPPARRTLRLGRHVRIGLCKTELPLRSRRLPAILCTEPCQEFDFPTIRASAPGPLYTCFVKKD